MPYYPQPDMKPRDGKPRSEKLLRRTALGLSLLLIGYGGVRLGLYVHDYFSARQTSRELRETLEALEETEERVSAEKETAWTETAGTDSEKTGSGREEKLMPEEGTDRPETAAELERTAELGRNAESERTAEPESNAKPAPSATAKGSPSPEAKESPTPAAKESPSAAANRLPPVEYPGGLQPVPKIRELRKKSEYIFGWLAMEGLEEPVVRKDNDFFLDHDAMGKRNGNGAIFMDEKTGLLTRPYTILLYGHNMKTGAMFGGLRKYEDFSYFLRHRIFQFDTLFEEGQYVIFAVEKIQITPGLSKYLDLYALTSSDRGIRRRAIETLKRLSVHETMLDVNEEDQLVLLITCVGDDEERLVVAARRLREGEQPDRLTVPNP